MTRFILGLAILGATVGIASAESPVTYTVTDQSYDDVLFGLENAIIDHGLVISNHNHVGAMLERTKRETNSDVTVYEEADVLGFCSAPLSRTAMLEDPMNIRFCPYNIFMFQESGSEAPVIIGYNPLPETTSLQDVQSLLDSITRSAIGID